MPAPEDTTASPPGPADELDISALYARLRQEIRRTGVVERGDNGRRSARSAVRGFAERYWAVTAERPLERRPGLKGALSQQRSNGLASMVARIRRDAEAAQP